MVIIVIIMCGVIICCVVMIILWLFELILLYRYPPSRRDHIPNLKEIEPAIFEIQVAKVSVFVLVTEN